MSAATRTLIAAVVATTTAASWVVPCLPGEYLEGVAAGCRQCPSGKYQEHKGQTSCRMCPEGRVGPGPGNQVCAECSTGLYMPRTGGAYCSKCPSGQVPSLSRRACTAGCPAGRFGNPLMTACYDCPGGTFQPRESRTSCATCPVGRAPNAGATACDAIVTKCAAGKFKAGDTVDNVEICRACPAGRFGAANNGSGRCELCPAGKYQPYEGKPSCFGLCPAGTYGSTAGAQSETEGCEACAPGRYQYHLAKTYCLDCPRGRAALAPFQACTPTPPPTPAVVLQATTAAAPLMSTPAPTYAATKADGTTCAAGRYTSKGWLGFYTECLECPRGSYSNTTVGMHRCVRCPEGSICNSRGCTRCKACAGPTGSARYVASVARDRCIAATPPPTPLSTKLPWGSEFNFMMEADHRPTWTGHIVLQRDGRAIVHKQQYPNQGLHGEWSVGASDNSRDASSTGATCELRFVWDDAALPVDKLNQEHANSSNAFVAPGGAPHFALALAKGVAPPVWFSRRVREHCFACSHGTVYSTMAVRKTCAAPSPGAKPRPGCQCARTDHVFDHKSLRCVLPSECKCELPKDIAHGYVDASWLPGRIGAIARYTCAAGFVRVGPAVRSCTGGAGGTGWTGTNVSCVADLCANAPQPQHARDPTLATDEHGVTTASWRCNEGYAPLSGRLTRTCSGGNWVGAPVVCARTCGAAPVAPVHSFLAQKNKTHHVLGADVHYKCKPGWRPKLGEGEGDSILFCLHTGRWSARPAACEPATCSAPPTVAGAEIATDREMRTSWWPHGTTVKYRCMGKAANAIQMVGKDTLKCHGQGVWGVPPACAQLKPCKSVQCVLNGNTPRVRAVHAPPVVQTLHPGPYNGREEHGNKHVCTVNAAKKCVCLCYHHIAPTMQLATP